MEIENSALMREITEIISSGSKPVYHSWFAQFHIGTETFSALKVVSVDIIRDYEGSYADQVLLTAMVPAGTYAKRIYPARSNLDVTLIRVPLGEIGDNVNLEDQVSGERYTAILLDKGDPVAEANGSVVPTEDTLNLSAMVQVQFQLIDKTIEQLRMISVGGIYRKVNVEDVLKTLMYGESQKLKVDGLKLPQGVDMVTANNQTVRDHILIPHGTQLTSLPEYVHKKCGGVYSAGIGYYLQDDFWYIYPCYDSKRTTESVRNLTFINVPSNKFPGIERTYRTNGNNTVAIVTGQVKFSDNSDATQLNAGNGVRFSDANKFMGGFTATEGNKTFISRGTNNSEFLAVKRDNGQNNVQLSENPITSNPFAEYSKLSRRSGGFLSLVWENSLPNLIYPGMVVKIMYLDGDEIKTTSGVILKVHHYVHFRGQGMMDTRYYNNSMISVFVQRKAS